MTQARYSIPSIINTLALTIHLAVALLLLVQLIALTLSGKQTALVAGLISVIVVLPVSPAIRRAFIDRSIAAAFKLRTNDARASLAAVAAAAGIVVWLLSWMDPGHSSENLWKERQVSTWLVGFGLIWLSSAIRELPMIGTRDR